MKKLALIAVLIFGGTQAYAADSGCGLGSLAITKNSKLLQLFALTTNQTTLTQALGITSGTSGCSASGIVMNDKEIQYYVEVNQEDLSREMAQGHGQKLAALAQMKGCQSEDAQKAFGEFTQGSYTTIIPAANTSSAELVQNLNKAMTSQSDLAQLCHGA